MAIGSWEVIHVAAGYAAVLYYIVTRFYFAAEELESSLFGFVSTLYCSSSFSPLLSSHHVLRACAPRHTYKVALLALQEPGRNHHQLR